MILKSIILTGFKSFGKKTVLDISKKVTGIVGPNGSGKSNIVEAIRFVMGEQSMKNIRSKSLSDLIHKGETAFSRASVSLVIDNRQKIYNENISVEMSGFLQYDEIVLTREIYKDGLSQYKINDANVRLKDIQELLGLAGIGQSVHTIISQGEADKILSSSPEDRKSLIADAIGLKVLENRLKESAKKLEKTDRHIETSNLLRREIAPELRELKLLVEKIDSVKDIRDKLKVEYIKFFLFENQNLENKRQKIGEEKNIESDINVLEIRLKEVRELIAEYESKSIINNQERDKKENIIRDDITLKEKEKSILIYQKNNILNKIKNEIKFININKNDFVLFKNNILNKVELLENNNLDILESNNIIKQIKDIVNSTNIWHDEIINTQALNQEIYDLNLKIDIIDQDIIKLKNSISQLRQEDNNNFTIIKNLYNQEKDTDISLRNKINKREYVLREMNNLKEEESQFNFNLKEAELFIGHTLSDFLQYQNEQLYIDMMQKYSSFDNKRQIEKYKIKIEEIGIIDQDIIKDSYQSLSEKDEHLRTEIQDLEDTRVKIMELIENLKVKIKEEFEIGFTKINVLFNNYFQEIFSGGSANLIPVKIQKRNKTIMDNDEQSDSLLEGEEDNIGIDININLPVKKIKDINMLSGGEKTLLSISLLFALTTLNTPPFMVLDETDAALDESNARKYGKLLQRLAQNSRLLVVTHNRETMNKADVLYGITIGGDGCSRILSIKFEE